MGCKEKQTHIMYEFSFPFAVLHNRMQSIKIIHEQRHGVIAK
jgi:hypothetical protein